jgi:hypothetical protein
MHNMKPSMILHQQHLHHQLRNLTSSRCKWHDMVPLPTPCTGILYTCMVSCLPGSHLLLHMKTSLAAVAAATVGPPWRNLAFRQLLHGVVSPTAARTVLGTWYACFHLYLASHHQLLALLSVRCLQHCVFGSDGTPQAQIGEACALR